MRSNIRLTILILLMFNIVNFIYAQKQITFDYSCTPKSKINFCTDHPLNAYNFDVLYYSYGGLNLNYTYYFSKNLFFQPGINTGFRAEFFNKTFLTNDEQYTVLDNCFGTNLWASLGPAFRFNIHPQHILTIKQNNDFSFFNAIYGTINRTSLYYKVYSFVIYESLDFCYDFIFYKSKNSKLSLNADIYVSFPIWGRGYFNYISYSLGSTFSDTYTIWFNSPVVKLNIGIGLLF